jgi:hypothetical protein
MMKAIVDLGYKNCAVENTYDHGHSEEKNEARF